MKKFDVVIVGAGIPGSSLAIALSQLGLKIALIDRQPLLETISDDYGLRVSAINEASQKWLEQIDVWKDIVASRVSPYKKMHVWNQKGEVNFTNTEIKKQQLGFIIENQVILLALANKIRATSNIDFLKIAPSRIQTYKNENILLFDDHDPIEASLIVGADGANSWVGKELAIEKAVKDYGHIAIVATIKTEKPHEFSAWQRFTKTGPIAFLPLPDKHHASIVFSQDKEKAEQLLSMNREDFCEELASMFEHRLGSLELASDRKFFPLIMRHAKNYYGPRIAMVADAIHTIHPLAGLGLNLGLRDVVCLYDLIKQAHEKHQDVASDALLKKIPTLKTNRKPCINCGNARV